MGINLHVIQLSAEAFSAQESLDPTMSGDVTEQHSLACSCPRLRVTDESPVSTSQERTSSYQAACNPSSNSRFLFRDAVMKRDKIPSRPNSIMTFLPGSLFGSRAREWRSRKRELFPPLSNPLASSPLAFAAPPLVRETPKEGLHDGY